MVAHEVRLERKEAKVGEGYVLSIWGPGDEPGDGPPIRLASYDRNGAGDLTYQTVATHDAAFDTSDLTYEGETVPVPSILKARQLMKKQLVRSLGHELWDRLTPGTIEDALTAIAMTERIHLDLRSPSLAAYPWEILRMGNTTPFSRSGGQWSLGHPASGPVPPVALDHPVRVLVVVGNNPADPIQSDRELHFIEAAANAYRTDVFLKTLIRPEETLVVETVETFRPHVFHFIGHGAIVGGDPELHVHRGQNNNVRWDAERIGDVFGDHPPRLAVLNACFAGTSGMQAGALHTAFTEIGTPAVVAMTEEVVAPAACAFTEAFYGRLLKGDAVDEAAGYARKAIRSFPGAEPDDDRPRLEASWPLARLFVRGAPGEIVSRVCCDPLQRRWMVPDFIARWDERFDAWKALDGSPTRLAVLTGASDSGRTELMRYIAETRSRDGDLVVMVELDEEESGRWRDVLAAIALQVADTDGIDAVPVQAAAARAVAETDGAKRHELIGEFIDALEAGAAGRRTLLAIDGLDAWSADLVAQLKVDLCEPFLSETAYPNLYLLITLGDDDNELDFGLPADVWGTVVVAEFPEDEWNRSLPHFIAEQSDDEAVREALHGLSEKLAPFDGRTAELLATVRDKARKHEGG